MAASASTGIDWTTQARHLVLLAHTQVWTCSLLPLLSASFTNMFFFFFSPLHISSAVKKLTVYTTREILMLSLSWCVFPFNWNCVEGHLYQSEQSMQTVTVYMGHCSMTNIFPVFVFCTDSTALQQILDEKHPPEVNTARSRVALSRKEHSYYTLQPKYLLIRWCNICLFAAGTDKIELFWTHGLTMRVSNQIQWMENRMKLSFHDITSTPKDFRT